MRRIIIGAVMTFVLTVSPLNSAFAKENQNTSKEITVTPTVIQEPEDETQVNSPSNEIVPSNNVNNGNVENKDVPKPDQNVKPTETVIPNNHKEEPKVEQVVTPVETLQPIQEELPGVKEKEKEKEKEREEEETYKVTLCHRTNSATNPYEKITVSVDAAGNFKDNGQGDHAIHTGPVATSLAVATALKEGGTNWGDIIPEGEHNTSLNWTTEGQAIYNNGCNYVTTPVDEEEETDKVVICHRTNSVTNPYVRIEVDESAVDGESNGDHYLEHQGPVATSEARAQELKDDKEEWGDIIPPVAGHHSGLNWTAEGQAMFNNNCNYVTPGQGTTNPPKPVVIVEQPTQQPGSGSVTHVAVTPVVTQAAPSEVVAIEMLPNTSSGSEAQSSSPTMLAIAIMAAVTTIVGLGTEALRRKYYLG